MGRRVLKGQTLGIIPQAKGVPWECRGWICPGTHQQLREGGWSGKAPQTGQEKGRMGQDQAHGWWHGQRLDHVDSVSRFPAL